MKWILRILVVLLALVGLVVVIGLLLPQAHVASRTVRLQKPPDQIWSVITDYANSPSWRSDLQRVERLPDHDGREVWNEIDKHGESMPLETLESLPPRRLVRRIADAKLPFGGTWTIEITPSDHGGTVTITENGEVYNPIFRFVSRFIMGHAASIEGYLKALGKKLGEDVVPAGIPQ